MCEEALPATEALARRLEAESVAFLVEWLDGARQQSGNPVGIELCRFGSAVAVACPRRSELDFLNRVMGLLPEDEGQVEAIAGFYRGLGVDPWVELLPGKGFEAVANRLEAIGGRQIGFHALLGGKVTTLDRDIGDAEIVRAGRAELDEFRETLLAGYGVDEPEAALHAHWADLPGWNLYLALVDGEAAAAAVLRLGGPVGLLATASTRPAFRGRGLQQALIRRRLVDAAAGCGLVAAQSAWGSASQRNLERAGLRILCTKAVWRLRVRAGTES